MKLDMEVKTVGDLSNFLQSFQKSTECWLYLTDSSKAEAFLRSHQRLYERLIPHVNGHRRLEDIDPSISPEAELNNEAVSIIEEMKAEARGVGLQT